MTRIEWNEQFKIRVRRNASRKHEHTKLEIVLNLIEKYKKQLYWIRIYTEYPLDNTKGDKKICDVYFENIKTREIICYEVQKEISNKWLNETKEFYENFDKLNMKTDWILVEEGKTSINIDKLEEQIKELII